MVVGRHRIERREQRAHHRHGPVAVAALDREQELELHEDLRGVELACQAACVVAALNRCRRARSAASVVARRSVESHGRVGAASHPATQPAGATRRGDLDVQGDSGMLAGIHVQAAHRGRDRAMQVGELIRVGQRLVRGAREHQLAAHHPLPTPR